MRRIKICSLLQYDKDFAKALFHLTKFLFGRTRGKKAEEKRNLFVCIVSVAENEFSFCSHFSLQQLHLLFVLFIFGFVCTGKQKKKKKRVGCYDLVSNFHCWINCIFAEFYEKFVALILNIFYAWDMWNVLWDDRRVGDDYNYILANLILKLFIYLRTSSNITSLL